MRERVVSSCAWARDWYAPIHEGKSYVNPNLTLARAKKHPKAGWDGQLVFAAMHARFPEHLLHGGGQGVGGGDPSA